MNLNTRNILFTGAGFSANFGGFLASDMWSLIFNHELVQEKEQVKEVMRRELEDFERAIEIIQSRAEYKDDEKKAIQIAVDYAYKLLDSKIIKEYDSEVSSGRLLDFIKLFKLNQKGFFFTLNQDLFVERFLLGVVRLRPGISQKKVSFRQKLPLKEWEICTVPTKEMIDRNKEQFISNTRDIMYIKLHGSQDWISSSGSGVKVIGGKKIEKIKKEPILSWYSELFEDVLNQNGIKMLIIAYSDDSGHPFRTKAATCRSEATLGSHCVP